MGLKRAMFIGLDAADPVICKRLMDEGKMPNLKKLLENGTSTETMSMIGALPSVTPPNWCSLATGNWPRTHGITCYQNQTLGQSLSLEQLNWVSDNVTSDFIWEQFQKEGKKAIVLNYCEAWPPRIKDDNIFMVDGTDTVPFLRSGLDYQKVIFMEEGDFPMEYTPHVIKSDTKDCIVMGDQFDEMKKQSMKTERGDLIRWAVPEGVMTFPSGVEDLEDKSNTEDHEESYRPSKADKLKTPIKDVKNWSFELPEGAKEATIMLAKNTIRRFGVLTPNAEGVYDTLTIYKNKRTEEPIGKVTGIGNWSEWVYDYYIKDDVEHKVAYKVNLCDMAADGSSAVLYVSHATDLDNVAYFYPQQLGKDLYEEIGPMIQFASVDVRGNSKENDKLVFDTYAKEDTEWFINAANAMFEKMPDWQLFYVHLHSIDNFQHWFINDTVPGRNPDWKYYRDLIDAVYTENDKFIGAMLEYLDDDTSIIVGSDHGCMPKSAGDEYAGIGSIGGITTKVMSEIGWTVTKRNPETGKLEIDYSKSRALAKRSSYIYLNVKGREPEGIVEPEDYHQAVLDLISDLYNYRNEDGKRVIAHCFTRDEMAYLGMGGIHCGDVLYQLVPTFNNEHANVFSTVHHEGCSMQNLLVMGGGAFREGETLQRTVRITDVVPTICHITGTGMPGCVEGGVIYQALKDGPQEPKYDRGDEWAYPTGERLIK